MLNSSLCGANAYVVWRVGLTLGRTLKISRSQEGKTFNEKSHEGMKEFVSMNGQLSERLLLWSLAGLKSHIFTAHILENNQPMACWNQPATTIHSFIYAYIFACVCIYTWMNVCTLQSKYIWSLKDNDINSYKISWSIIEYFPSILMVPEGVIFVMQTSITSYKNLLQFWTKDLN